MIDFFVKSAGRLELREFIDTMNNVIHAQPNLRGNPAAQGIHQMGTGSQPGAGQESWTPLQSFANFSEDGTATVKNAAFMVRPASLPGIDERKVEDLQKACFVSALTV